MFLISVLLALVILFYVEFMVGLASFYTLSMFGMAFTKTAVLSILSGGVVPLALFPEGVARVFGLLPFAGMVSVPLNIFLGKYRLEECMGYMGLQIFWCIIMGAIAHLLYHMVIRKVIVQGG
ncbi:MAG: ABC-2 family transporter protein [Faecalimonas umbilicata]